MVQQHVDQVLEQVWFCGAEEAILDLIYGQFQLRQTLVELPSVVAAGRQETLNPRSCAGAFTEAQTSQ